MEVNKKTRLCSYAIYRSVGLDDETGFYKTNSTYSFSKTVLLCHTQMLGEQDIFIIHNKSRLMTGRINRQVEPSKNT